VRVDVIIVTQNALPWARSKGIRTVSLMSSIVAGAKGVYALVTIWVAGPLVNEVPHIGVAARALDALTVVPEVESSV